MNTKARSLNSRDSRTFSSFFEDFCWIYSQMFKLSNGLEVLSFSVRKNMDVTKNERLSNFALTQNHRYSAFLAVLRFTVTVGSSNMSLIVKRSLDCSWAVVFTSVDKGNIWVIFVVWCYWFYIILIPWCGIMNKKIIYWRSNF